MTDKIHPTNFDTSKKSRSTMQNNYMAIQDTLVPPTPRSPRPNYMQIEEEEKQPDGFDLEREKHQGVDEDLIYGGRFKPVPKTH